MAERTAVLGVGQTKYQTTRGDVSLPGLVREAAYRALEDAEVGWDDIDAVVVGKAPDFFEGVMQPELFLAEALGAVGKPLLRVHTAGSVGGSTAVVAASLVQAGIHRRVLTLGFEKQSESNATWALSLPQPFSVSINAGAGGYFSPIIRQYMARSNAPELIGCMVAFKDRQHALRNPYAHLQQQDLTFDQVVESPMLWEPIRFSETCPSSDGACAIVLGDEAAGDASTKPVAWIHGAALRSEANNFPGRDEVNPQASRDCADDVFAQAGITDRRAEIDEVEIYVPFSWYEPMWLESLGFCEIGDGWKLVEEGATHLDGGDLPVNCSGGVLSSNPIGASGMIRFAEAALQVRGMAGDHQVDGVRKAFGHAYGGGAQYYAMWIVGADKPTS
ncbi:MAG: thiolase domain-containing protein [bacterium]|nr:thiolase domain-containing protein [bacterium]MDE0615482.1 thiolase domain-containing protein [bacterium]MYB10013.1 thiolase domain-containing protein [Acidimicrobiia bacterium]MYG59735.1 thiolase domain-containing protein [Acidimicrobiia bacterium]MYJ34172.1 thiolase domain-containing protein [Acidimicrobiia bacterium]